MRTEHPRGLPWLAGLFLALGCQSDRLLTPVDSLPEHPGLEAIAVRVEVDVVQGTVRVLQPAARNGAGPSLSILGFNEVGVAANNLVRSAPVDGKVTVTFDAALTNRLTSSSLVPSSFPSIAGGLVLFPFQVTQVVGGSAPQVVAGPDWNGDGSAGSGAPRNFFNDVGCPSTSALADCFRWEQYPAPLGPGQTTAAQKVGFTLPKAITSFQVLMVLTADVSNDLPAVAAIGVTPASYVMNDGFPATFTAVAYDVRNQPLPWVTLTWTTADITALEFQSGGSLVGTITGASQVVHGRKVGLTSFTVRSGGVAVVVPVDIQVNTVALVQLYTPDSSLTAGDQVQGDARVKDHSGQIIPGLLPTWSTTDPNVITVDQNGLITAVGAGTANVIATAGNQSAAVIIIVDRLIAGDLAGTMRDLEGQPVKGATLTATGFTGAFTTTTGDDGSYLFHNLPITGTGVYLLQWSPAGCTAGAQNRIILLVGGVVTVDIDTDCPPSVSGVVTMVQGTLPAGVTVELRPDAGGANRVGTVQPDGSYSITGVPSGGYFIFMNGLPANCSAFGAQSISLTQQAHYVKDWSVDCQSTSGLTGQVRDVEGGPIAGATVDVQSQTTGQMFSTTADAAGGYSLLLPPDEYGITVSKPGPCVSFGTFNFTVPAGQPRGVNPVMDCPWHVLGRVVALGGPLPPSLVVFVPSPGPLEQADVLSDGTYEIVELPYPNGASGALSLDLFGLPSRCVVTGGPFNITVTQQMQLQVPDFTLDCRPPSIQVLVTDGGTNPDPQPLIDMQVILIGPSGSSNSQTGTTGQDGILFQNAEAGSNFIAVAQGTHGCSGNTAGVTAQPGTQYNVVVPVSCSTTGALQGTLRSALGNPIPNATIIVGTYSLTTDSNGHWGVAGLPAGLLFVNVLPPLPGGCTGPGAVQAAVIPMFTITVDLTATCPGF